jgi:hypothetical protein
MRLPSAEEVLLRATHSVAFLPNCPALRRRALLGIGKFQFATKIKGLFNRSSKNGQFVDKSNNSVFQQACTKHHLKMPPDLALYLRVTLRKTNSVQWRTGFLGGQLITG